MSALKFIATFAAYIFLCCLGLSAIYLASQYVVAATLAATGGNAVLAVLAGCAVLALFGGVTMYVATYILAKSQ
jgi:hypothetical protein